MERPWRVLVVDDHPASLVLVAKVLGSAGFELLEARSGGEALAVAEENAPDMVLLDMHLPDMHGLDVLRRIRESAWGAELRVVAVSALASPEDQRAWLQAGCVGVLEKPINAATLADAVLRWVSAAEPVAPRRAEGGVREVAPREAGPREAGPPDYRRPGRIGEILVASGLVTREQIDHALAEQAQSGRRLGQILVQQGVISEDDLAWALSSQLGYPYVFLAPEIVDEATVRLLSPEFQREHHVLPVLAFGGELTLAMSDPTDQRTVDEVETRTGLHVKRALALASNIEQMHERFFAAIGVVEQVSPREAAPEAQYFQFHLLQALRQGAREIHFDPPGEGQARVRFRIEGVLVDRSAHPAALHAAMLRHLRAITGAGVELPAGPVRTIGAAEGEPTGPGSQVRAAGAGGQAAATGSAAVEVEGNSLTLVAAFLPTLAGPAATVSLYPLQAEVPEAAALAAAEEPVRRLQGVLDNSRGLVLVGCAERWERASLVHALLPRAGRGKVWVLEAVPIFRRPTINQTIVAPPALALGHLRTVVEAGADVIALDDASHDAVLLAAAEAGCARLVLAGHPRDDLPGLLAQAVEAAGAARMASALLGMLVARPVRLLCTACRQPAVPRGFIQAGCEACGFTGFRGSRMLVDAWIADPGSRLLLQTGRAAEVIERLAQAVPAMGEQAMRLVEEGLTSPGEVVRVMGGVTWTSPTS